jgi:hypothetical protein
MLKTLILATTLAELTAHCGATAEPQPTTPAPIVLQCGWPRLSDRTDVDYALTLTIHENSGLVELVGGAKEAAHVDTTERSFRLQVGSDTPVPWLVEVDRYTGQFWTNNPDGSQSDRGVCEIAHQRF